MIAVWPDSPDTPPSGWVVCNGENGTPDLRGMLIMGAVVGAGEQGGTETHDHPMEAHDHYAYFPHDHPSSPVPVRTDTTLPERTGHAHDIGTASEDFSGDTTSSDLLVAADPHGHFYYFDSSTIHEHDLVLEETIAPVGSELDAETMEKTSSVIPAEHLPPYYKAVFVLKLSEKVRSE
jgi:hypothetical protein